MVEVTQEDRILVADLIRDLGEADQFEIEEILSGQSDFTAAVQRAAASRAAAEHRGHIAGMREAAGIAEVEKDDLEGSDDEHARMAYNRACDRASQAIRQRATAIETGADHGDR